MAQSNQPPVGDGRTGSPAGHPAKPATVVDSGSAFADAADLEGPSVISGPEFQRPDPDIVRRLTEVSSATAMPSCIAWVSARRSSAAPSPACPAPRSSDPWSLSSSCRSARTYSPASPKGWPRSRWRRRRRCGLFFEMVQPGDVLEQYAGAQATYCWEPARPGVAGAQLLGPGRLARRRPRAHRRHRGRARAVGLGARVHDRVGRLLRERRVPAGLERRRRAAHARAGARGAAARRADHAAR